MHKKIYDLIIVGGGPAGLSAGINAAAEGLDVAVLEGSVCFGGQASTIKEIKNLMGCQGIAGKELIARALAHLRTFEVPLFAPYRVTNILRQKDGSFEVHTSHGRSFTARAVLITAGVRYRRLEVVNVSSFLGYGVYYGELPDSVTGEVYVIGGGNGAGQAAMALAGRDGCNVHLLIRGSLLDGHMSQYLIDGVKEAGNVTIHEQIEVVNAHGTARLKSLTLRHNDDSTQRDTDADHLLISIGSAPHVEWAKGVVVTDKRGFIAAGHDAASDAVWADDARGPLPFETTQGVFVAGDVLSGSVKRVGNAVGTGQSAVVSVLNYLGRT